MEGKSYGPSLPSLTFSLPVSMVRFSLGMTLFLAACSPQLDPVVEVELQAQAPDDSRSVRWSPRGEKLPLNAEAVTELSLGGAATMLQLERLDGSESFNALRIDFDRDGSFAPDEVVRTEPSETRGKTWSSFDATIQLPVEGSGGITVPYPLAF
ncbi:MAG: hypothetical protein ACI9W4_002961, partial [Rhodothermales bacterium]